MTNKIVLVKPPEESPFHFGAFSLSVLAASVRDLVDVVILDTTELSPQRAAREVWSHKPELIGITVMSVPSVRPVAAFIRNLASTGTTQVPIIAGGHGASIMPRPLLKAGAKAVVAGEGERTFRRIVTKGISSGSPGLVCLEGNHLVQGPPQSLIRPLDQLNPPSRDQIPNPMDGVYLLETSRGCPHSCSFCEVTRFYGRQWRPQSPERVAEEVRNLVDDHRAEIIHFVDDNFTAHPGRVLDICEKLQKQSRPFFFMVSARADDLLADPDLLPAMASAGILRITVGVESLDFKAAQAVHKPISFSTYQEVFRRMRELGIFSVASFIVGLPGEDGVAREKAVQLAVEAAPDSAKFIPFWPLPGTPLGMEEGDFEPKEIDTQDACRFNASFLNHPQVRKRLKSAENRKGIRGLLAQATLEKNACSPNLAP